ncbi:Nucleoside 5-triphosphatase RdgB (dHAPTP, dITP, XTP-specific) [hydrothermal vent metagenome]|uniref:dITP/XTP pyrophosphatase n=1 Tax=hydrothermal vent metagenome TaxID=652676 RepID=A0A3B0RK73_9ZZZZ
MRRFDADKLVVASHNAGKVREISALMRPFGVETLSAADLNLPEPVEDGETFIANAELKARSAAEKSGLMALADDSGLVVPALGGRPGIHSARWAINPATGARDFAYGMQKLEDELGADDRTAYFACALTLAWPDGHVESFEGRVNGTLVWPIRGGNGFGYDPMFQADGYDITFGEMDASEKHNISHRANAFKKLIHACFS